MSFLSVRNPASSEPFQGPMHYGMPLLAGGLAVLAGLSAQLFLGQYRSRQATLLALTVAAVALAWLYHRATHKTRQIWSESQEIENKLRLIIEGAAEMITEHELDEGRILAASHASAQWGYPPDELVGKSILDLIHTDERQAASQDLQALKHNNPASVSVKYRIYRADGSVAWVETVAQRVDGPEPRIIAVSRDVSGWVEREHRHQTLGRQLRQAAEEWTKTFDAIDSPILIVGENQSIERLNRAAAALLGKRPREAVRLQLRDLPGVLGTELPELVHEARGRDETTEGKLTDPGESRTWSVRIHRTPTLAHLGHVIVLNDVTDLTTLRESLKRQERLAAIGSLVANISHEVRNYIFCIGGLVAAIDRSSKKDEQDEQFSSYVDALQTEVGRLQTLMTGLLEYGRPDDLQRELVEARQLARKAVQAIEIRAQQHKVSFDLQIDIDECSISVDRLRWIQVLVNVLDNAIVHSPGGGVITLQVAAVGGQGNSPPQVRFRVRDQGPGFKDEHLSRAFEPFYSRREGGTGLGLAVVQRLVDLHGGDVHLGNAPEGGAQVDILIALEALAVPAGATE